MMSTVRAPAIVRANTSRPRSSVPDQWEPSGALRMAPLGVVGLWVTCVEKSAMVIQKTTTARPTRKVGVRKSELMMKRR